MGALRTLAAILAVLTTAPASLAAGLWQAGDFVFSDELGGFEILSVSGTGTADDPVVIVERITQLGPSIIVVRPASGQEDYSPDFRANPFMQLSLVIAVTNDSRRVWAGFDLELQEELGQPSVYRDGLSFDQLHTFDNRVFWSNRFATFSDLSEPYDRVRFEHGLVNHGDIAEFQVFITDVTPRSEFYLLQEPQLLLADAPADEPTKVMLARVDHP